MEQNLVIAAEVERDEPGEITVRQRSFKCIE